jgi:hypothetical protein
MYEMSWLARASVFQMWHGENRTAPGFPGDADPHSDAASVEAKTVPSASNQKIMATAIPRGDLR